MKIKLLSMTSREVALHAIRTCWQSFDKADYFGENDKKLIRKIIQKGHLSTLEHCSFTFFIEGITRACLQELCRHRIGTSFSVESTRYTLKKILNQEVNIEDIMVDTGSEKLNNLTNNHMENLRNLIKEEGLTNDIAKYGICENYPVRLQMTMNVRSLRHFYQLRSSKAAHFEIRNLAEKLMESIPEEYKIFFEDLIKE